MTMLYLVFAYTLLGGIFSIPFLFKWITIVDEAARESSWSFKIMILPGCIIFWPVLLKRYLTALKSQHND